MNSRIKAVKAPGVLYQWTWLELIEAFHHRPKALFAELEGGAAICIRQFLSRAAVKQLRDRLFCFRAEEAEGWQACVDGCPDYHRAIDENPFSRIKTRMRVFQFHRWNNHSDLFQPFFRIFELKARLAGRLLSEIYDNVPSQIIIPRLTVNHYPVGGGYLAEHVDPVGDFAKVQTLVQLSERGKDFTQGGLYYRSSIAGQKISLEEALEPGDLLLLSPGLPHGVEAIDPDQPLDWKSRRGRLMAVPIIVHSDCSLDATMRSKMVKSDY